MGRCRDGWVCVGRGGWVGVGVGGGGCLDVCVRDLCCYASAATPLLLRL